MTHTIEKVVGATSTVSTNTKPCILILGDVVYAHLETLVSVATLHGSECVSMDDLAHADSTDLWALARECIDHGAAIFIHATRQYIDSVSVQLAGLVMYALGRDGKVVLAFDADVTIYQHAHFESITDALGYRAYKFILPDAVPVMLRYFLQYTDALGPLSPPPGPVRRPQSPRGAVN
jgi:hypothetical protein